MSAMTKRIRKLERAYKLATREFLNSYPTNKTTAEQIWLTAERRLDIALIEQKAANMKKFEATLV